MSRLSSTKLIAPAVQGERGRPMIIDVDPMGKTLLYCHGKSVYLLNLQDGTAEEYREHLYGTSAARFSPCATKVASAGTLNGRLIPSTSVDAIGNVRIWEAQGEHRLRATYRLLPGKISDLAWDGEGQHVIGVGEGKDELAKAILVETGSSLGCLAGPIKTANGAAIRPCRPYRAAIASDDYSVTFYSGTPYKLVRTIRDHARFALCVSYASDGSVFATGGADGKIFVYDGLEGGQLFEASQYCHAPPISSSITGLCWKPENSKLLASSSIDGTLRIWRFEGDKANVTVKNLFEAQQLLGIKWTTRDEIVLVNDKGTLIIIDPETLQIKRIFQGHTKSITAVVSSDGHLLASASYDGRVLLWKGDKGEVANASTICLDKAVTGLFSMQNHLAVFNKFDGSVQLFSLDKQSPSIIMSPPKGVIMAGPIDSSLVYCSPSSLTIIDPQSQAVLATLQLSFMASLFAIQAPLICYYTEKEKTIRLVDFGDPKNPKELTEEGRILRGSANATIASIAISPDRLWIAAGDDQRRIQLYNLSEGKMIPTKWCFHRSTVNCLAWSNDSKFLASGGLDGDLILWSPQMPLRPLVQVNKAHAAPLTALAFLTDKQLVSAGQDAALRYWRIDP